MSEPQKVTISKEMAIKKLEPAIIDMVEYIRQGKCGSISVNFYMGGVANWNLTESKKCESKK